VRCIEFQPDPERTLPWRLLDGYQPLRTVADELVDADGQLRPHCETFVPVARGARTDEIAVAVGEAPKRTIRDTGVTYNVYGDPQGIDRPWTLDMLPFLIPVCRVGTAWRPRSCSGRGCSTWCSADLYGPQRLLHERRLPAPLVLGNPGFLRPCHGIPVPRGVYLHLHAVDLGRSADGKWWVLADRTQSPSGAGYALENRIVLSRSLPEAFRDCRVQRLAAFFRAQRDGLTALGRSAARYPTGRAAHARAR
jgi:uncharacterized circularly permuted ATP-grasp superfamily protein